MKISGKVLEWIGGIAVALALGVGHSVWIWYETAKTASSLTSEIIQDQVLPPLYDVCPWANNVRVDSAPEVEVPFLSEKGEWWLRIIDTVLGAGREGRFKAKVRIEMSGKVSFVDGLVEAHVSHMRHVDGDVLEVSIPVDFQKSLVDEIVKLGQKAGYVDRNKRGEDVFAAAILVGRLKALVRLASRGNTGERYHELQYEVGLSYYNGEGVEKDAVEAVRYWREAAEKGHAAAQFCLGGCYENGEGVEKDSVEAVKWYRKAAKQGDEDAKKVLEKLESDDDQ